MMNNRILIISLIVISLFSLEQEKQIVPGNEPATFPASLSGIISNKDPLFVNEDAEIGSSLRIVTYTGGHPMTITATSADAIELIAIPHPKLNSPAHFNLTLKKKLDRDWEPPTRYLHFKISDTGGNEVTLRIDMIVQDVNDESPSFEGEPYNIDIPENTETGVILTVIATDPDSGPGGVVNFFMDPKAQADATKDEYRQTFSIDATTGAVKLNKDLNYEINTFYQYNVSAKDNAEPYHYSYTTLIIRVTDVQDTPPIFGKTQYGAEINEGVSNGTPVLTVSARDGDTGNSNQIFFSMIDGADPSCQDLFLISNTTGEITTAVQLDRDEGVLKKVSGSCEFNVKATEGTEFNQTNTNNQTRDTTNASVTIHVNDINDNTPIFNTDRSHNASVPENTAHGIPITLDSPGHITVTDIDQGTFAAMETHVISAGGCADDTFMASPQSIQSSGEIQIIVNNSTSLDFEKIRQCVLTITVTETANRSHSANATLYLSITDVNDNNPSFSEERYTTNILENSKNKTHVINITATDADRVNGGNVTHTLFGGNNRFQINSTTGEITTHCDQNCSVDFDRERMATFYLTIVASDEDGRSDTALLIVNLNDTNDNSPIFEQSRYTVYIEEGCHNTSQYLTTVSAADNDEGINKDISYRLNESGTFSDNFTINNTTGEIFLKNCLDFERICNSTRCNATADINLSAVAYDHGSTQRSSSVYVFVQVRDMNDNEPKFDQSVYNFSVTENSPEGFYIGQVLATDKDGTKRNNEIKYFFESGDYDNFRIDSTTGNVTVRAGRIDRETTPFYNLTIIASDLGGPQKTGTTTLLMEVIDVNDADPSFSQTEYSVSVKENSTERFVLKLNATDQDLDSYLVYNITKISAKDENDSAVNMSMVEDYFFIHSTNGEIYQSPGTDREVAKHVTLTVQVTDLNSSTGSQTNKASLVITLLDINDNVPIFNPATYNFSVVENAEKSVLATIRATDRDENRTITYSLVDDFSKFQIDATTGVLQTSSMLDRETNETIYLTVQATDDGVPTSNSSLQVQVTVLDVNDNTPWFSVPEHQLTIAENTPLGDRITTITVTDRDAGYNANISVVIESSLFCINETTVIDANTMQANITVCGQLDRETQQQYTVKITAHDNPLNVNDRRTNETSITITLTDTNDNPPVFSPNLISVEIVETFDINKTFLTVFASDKDFGNNSVVRYSIEKDTSPIFDLFHVNDVTGNLYPIQSLRDHVTSNVVTILALDGGNPALNGSLEVNITILDENLHEPVVLNLPNGDIDIYECTRNGSVIHTFNASDADHGQNAKVDFLLTDAKGENVTDFHIDKTTGQLRVNSFLSVNHTDKYELRVQGRDNGVPKLTSDPYHFSVTLIDVDDHMPFFEMPSVTMRVEEERVGATLGTVLAKDEDKISNSCYRLNNVSSWQGYFKLNETEGTISTTKKLDKENMTSDVIHITVDVYPCGSGQLNASVCDNTTAAPKSKRPTQIINVTVVDINDNPPEFKEPLITFGMRRNVDQGTTLDIQLNYAVAYLRIGSYATGYNEMRIYNKDHVKDADKSPQNGQDAWSFENNGALILSADLQGNLQVDGGTDECGDGVKHLFCVTGNGTVINNRWFREDLSGYVNVPVLVQDVAGNSTAVLKIFLVSDSQVLMMTILGMKTDVSLKKEELLRLFSTITKYTFVYDKLEDHKSSDGTIDNSKTDLYFHVVDPITGNILSAADAKRLIDKESGLLQLKLQFNIISIGESQTSALGEEDTQKTFYTLIAVISLLSLSIIIVVYAFCSSVTRYKRKLRAATVSTFGGKENALEMTQTNLTIPGSNVFAKTNNPLLNSKIDDIEKVPLDEVSLSSHNSMDENEVGESRPEDIYDAIEEREVTLDMYGEDTFQEEPAEDPLDAALRAHEQSLAEKNAKNDAKQSSPYMNDDDIGGYGASEAMGFENHAYNLDDFESSEI